MPLSRKERKRRILELTQELVDYIYSQAISDSIDVADAFDRFCVIKQIHTPQLKATRDAIVMKIDDVMKEIEKRSKNGSKKYLHPDRVRENDIRNHQNSGAVRCEENPAGPR